jgi:hypothetical protein
METGKLRISTAVQLGARVVGKRAPERVLGQVAVPQLEHVLVQAELERGLVAVPERELGRAAEPETSELVTALVVAALELECDLVEAVLLPSQPRAQRAVALRTKWVTGAHHHGLVPLLAAEDLAAAAETTREPAAAEAVIAWEVAE